MKFICDMLSFFPSEWDYVLIPDSRFPNEVDYLRYIGFDVTHIRVIRENFVSPLTEEQQKHPSETALDNVKADKYIINNGTLSDLHKAVADWVFEVNGEHQTSIYE